MSSGELAASEIDELVSMSPYSPRKPCTSNRTELMHWMIRSCTTSRKTQQRTLGRARVTSAGLGVPYPADCARLLNANVATLTQLHLISKGPDGRGKIIERGGHIRRARVR